MGAADDVPGGVIPVAGLAGVAVLSEVVNLPSVDVWSALGKQMRRVLNKSGRMRLFNVVMTLLLVASLIPVPIS